MITCVQQTQEPWTAPLVWTRIDIWEGDRALTIPSKLPFCWGRKSRHTEDKMVVCTVEITTDLELELLPDISCSNLATENCLIQLCVNSVECLVLIQNTKYFPSILVFILTWVSNEWDELQSYAGGRLAKAL